MATLNKKYTDYTILSEPRFKSGVAVIDKAVEKGAQPRNTKRYRKYNQPTVASPAGLKEAIKAKQRKLAEAGFYKGKIDGIWGKKSKAAQAAYDKANGKRGETVFDTISRNKLNLLNQAKGIETKGLNIEVNRNLSDLKPEERKEFAEWLFKNGLEGIGTKIGNAFATGANWAMSMLGIPAKNTVQSDGMHKLVVALHLYDDSDIYQRGDTLVHNLGYDSNGLYKWQLLNGKQDTNEKRNLIDRATKEPGTYIAGRYSMKQLPDKMFIDNDNYDFNDEGTKRARLLIESGNGDLYQRFRAWAGEIGANKPIPDQVEIPMSVVNSWINEWYKTKK